MSQGAYSDGAREGLPLQDTARTEKSDYLIAGGILVFIGIVIALVALDPDAAEIAGYVAVAAIGVGLLFTVLVVMVRDTRDSIQTNRSKSEGENF